MRINRVIASVAAVGALGAVAAYGPLTAEAAPQRAYPPKARPYVAHPAGFDDSKYVSVRNGKVSCREPLATATSGDVKVVVRKELQPLVQELLRQTETKYHYDLRAKYTGGYNCRLMRGSSTKVSNHAYGRAVDMNWDKNPYSKTFKSDIPPAVVKLWISHGFYWGGHYSKTKDTMHFEYVDTMGNAPKHLKNLKAGK